MTSTTTVNKDIVLVVSLVLLSAVSLVLLFGVTWYFQSSLDLLQQQVEYDRELLFKLQEQINVSIMIYAYTYVCMHVCTCNMNYTYVCMHVHNIYTYNFVS